MPIKPIAQISPKAALSPKARTAGIFLCRLPRRDDKRTLIRFSDNEMWDAMKKKEETVRYIHEIIRREMINR